MNTRDIIKATATAAADKMTEATADLHQRIARLEALVSQLVDTRIGSSERIDAADLLRDGAIPVAAATAKAVKRAIEREEAEAWDRIEDEWNGAPQSPTAADIAKWGGAS